MYDGQRRSERGGVPVSVCLQRPSNLEKSFLLSFKFMLMPLPKIFMVVSILFMLMIDSAPLVYYLTVDRFLALGQY